MIDIVKLTNSVTLHEGTKPWVYDDATGLPIISGRRVIGNPTIGIGRLLTKDKGLTNDEIQYLWRNDIQSTIRTAQAQYWWPSVDDNEPRARAMCEIIFNMGIKRLGTFIDALSFLAQGDYGNAAKEFMDSRWAQQVGNRAVVLTTMIRDGKD